LLLCVTSRRIGFWFLTVYLLLWGRPVIPSLFNLFIGDEELLSNLFVWDLKKKGRMDLNTLVSWGFFIALVLRDMDSRGKMLWPWPIVWVLGLYRIGIISKDRSIGGSGTVLTIPPLRRDLWFMQLRTRSL
jgi:hypothetical protein